MTNDVVSAFIERWSTKPGLNGLIPHTSVFDGDQSGVQPPYAIVRRPFGAVGVRYGAGHRRDDVTLDIELVATDQATLKAAVYSMTQRASNDGFDLDRWVGYSPGQELETLVLPHSEEKDPETGQWHFFVSVIVRDNLR